MSETLPVTREALSAIPLPTPALTQELAEAGSMPEVGEPDLRKAIAELDPADSLSILSWGAEAQRGATEASESILDGVRNKDIGPAQAALSEVVATMRGFSTDALKEGEPGFFGKLLGKVSPVVKFLQRYEMVDSQIEAIQANLDRHARQLMSDIEKLDRMYAETLGFYARLDIYIQAGEAVLAHMTDSLMPELRQTAEKNPDDMIAAQKVRDFQNTIDSVERRLHDLKLTRQIVIQNMPAIRNTQDVDKGLVAKIQSVQTNTIPMWKRQLAIAITANRATQAAEAVNDVNDLTNELLVQSSESLKTANREARKAIERGVVDIEAVEQANANLMATLTETMDITEQARRRRAEAEERLKACESQLRDTLLSQRKAAQSAG
ncbi:toxic anion resistance protein [Roseospirillum parvum]|uniref:Uncharacterized conserved protein YaaN involved in tellurite resistance n=1 Tax=Roseospirillum parvum TaxID=83401 RepID=A0A1G7UYA7_9PROT|nr:toxic anion resistance protein [Roseospirillum parvum]SDG52278.1 Uncharacterized conserved protein YaaN involved in tellurite resistance [Roseospirillum parvum]